MIESTDFEQLTTRVKFKNRIYLLESKIHELLQKIKRTENERQEWKLKCNHLLRVNTRLEKEIKDLNEKKFVGLLGIGNVHEPKIDRNYKFKE
jgi:hypothetical protein